jgi:two-component system sensor histidine kinase KdpD
MVAARSATETERVRNTLLASVSHDFRTPLSSILGSATSLIDYGDKIGPEAQKDLLVQIKEEAEALDDMVRNLLAITRIDAGALELRKDWIDVHEIVGRVVNAARRQRGAHIDVELPRDMPLLRADPTLVEQALTNIVANAIAHTPKDTKVAIGAQILPAQVGITVSDDGPGIPAELIPRLFDKFSRARQSEQVQGAGLGLAIAKGIMDAHGGSIAAQSPVAKGRGTRMVLTFPREEAPR